ncbi:protein O-mannosyl-transferase Tmtc3 [Parasteatoda tepidariorum]|uniref:protein O-mannosyl-transferase Tmtc3 n=1 Tax=Parasteatoda tepidariorum TaxID=114398 RepID=UPI00077FCBF3|nr:protein O-mannosyl-transferase Tmtc3 [Parasteatoda tepidariorum]
MHYLTTSIYNMAESFKQFTSNTRNYRNNKEKSCIEKQKKIAVLGYALLYAGACLCYLGALECGFVFDDISAIRENRDLRPTSPWSNLLQNDFWGTPMQKEQSHKSYRPVCVLTYRLNYLIHGLQPLGYHLVNIALHALVCLLYKRTCELFVSDETAFLAAFLFAVHPLHTEAVTGVVGRAEILSSLFYLLSFLSYTTAATKRFTTEWFSFGCCLCLVTLATFSKEQGITVIGLCCVYDFIILHKVRLPDIGHLMSGKGQLKEVWRRTGFLATWALFLLVIRLKVMGVQLPVFTKFDNPAAASETPTRQLTFNYLVALNGWLLLNPNDLCCDWTMGSVPLLRSWIDPRNAATLALYGILIAALWNSLWVDDSRSRILLMGLSMSIFPFLPASNLFFPVGFVVAERVLYAPSMGFCLLVAQGTSLLSTRRPGLIWTSLILLLCIHAAKTVRRNADWKSEYALFLSGIKVNQRNAKLYNNVGHCLETQGKYSEALNYFHTAIRVEPDDIGAHINVGRTHNHLGMYEEAEKAFRKAKDLLPKPPFGEGYEARVAPSHLNVFLNLANLISRDGTRLEEADDLYQEAIRMRSDYIEAYINRGDILIRMNRTQEAQNVYEKALHLDEDNADIHYNLGVVLLEQRKTDMALLSFNKALKINPRHEQALLNSAILIQETGGPNMRKTAYHRLKALLKTKEVNERVYFHLGMLAMDDKNFTLAEKWFRRAVELRGDFRSALFNLALLLSEAKRPTEALPFLQQLRQHHPDHIKGLILLGDIFINTVKDLDSAQECYESILTQEPMNVQALHNLCVVYVERGQMDEAEECLEKAAAIAPNEQYVTQHLSIVRSRRHQLIERKNQNKEKSSVKRDSNDFLLNLPT